MPLRAWFKDDGPWWTPYLGVALLAALGLLVALVFAALNAGEIIRTLRAAGA
jgi:hypothetical protein